MGANFAHDLATEEFGLSLEQQISIHLTANHYPPVPTSMVSVCIEAIDAYNSGDHDAEIELPDGVSYKGRQTAPAGEIIDAHHLGEWIVYDLDW